MLAVLPLAAAALSVPSVDPSPDALECGYRKLAYAQALKLQPWRGAQRATWDALELGTMCGETPPPDNERVALPPAEAVAPLRSVYVDAERGSDAASGEVDSPFRGVHRALAALRASGGKKDAIVLKDGIHYLNQTLTLGPEDSGTTITAAPGADAWLSGGAPLPQLQWKKVQDHPSGGNVWGASLAGTGVAKVPGLFTAGSHDRFVRARFPNANPEHACWGYSCPDKDTWSLNSDQVAEWHKPPAGPPPTPSTFDFSVLPNAAGVVKNDSAQGP